MAQGVINEIGRYRYEQGYYRLLDVSIGISETGRFCKELIRNNEIAVVTESCSALLISNYKTHFVYGGGVFLSFDTSFQMPKYVLRMIEGFENTVANLPIYFTPIANNTAFDAVFTNITDAELINLQTFLYDTLPLFDTFNIYIAARDYYLTVKAHRKMNIKPLFPNHNQVTLSLIIVP